MDYQLFQAINGLAGRSHALDVLMIAIATYSPLLYALALLALWLTWRQVNQRGALIAGVSALVALGLGQLLGAAFPRERPYLVHHVMQLISHSVDTSFPSDHTTMAFAVAVGVWVFNRRAGVLLLALGAVLAFARVFVGAHYPGDVLGGAILGTLTSAAFVRLAGTRRIAHVVDSLFDLLRQLRLAAKR
jgi:undecaprenyl-diphosphatase